MNSLKSLVAATSLGVAALTQPGCTTYSLSSDVLERPEKKDSNFVERVLPVDKVYRIPEAAWKGLVVTALLTDYETRQAPLLMKPVAAATSLFNGAVHTTLDTAVNAVSWLPLEISEMFSGETWVGPYMPVTKSVLEGKYFEEQMENLGY